MPNTYSQIYIHVVFAVKFRAQLIAPEWEDHLYRYITGIVIGKDQLLIAINGMPDHMHILIGMKPSCCLSDLVREVKKSSVEFIRQQQLSPFRFQWQEGFGAFSCSRSSLDTVIRYIRNQKEHHRKRTFREEYIGFLKKYEIDYKEAYLFDWME